MENNEVKQEEFYEETNYDLINEEELRHINPELDHNFTYTTMNSGIMSIHHNDSENIIDKPEDFTNTTAEY